MDNQEDLNQLIERLDDLKIQSLEYTKKNVKKEKEFRDSQEKIETSFENIKAVLQKKPKSFAEEVADIRNGLREFPGIKIRRRGISVLEGIGPETAQTLKGQGITSLSALLSKAAAPHDRKSLAKSTGVSQDQILRWVTTADLFRVRGIGQGYADLLEQAGVETTRELAQRRPENLHQKLIEINAQKNLVRQVPTLTQVSEWVGQAKELKRVVEY